MTLGDGIRKVYMLLDEYSSGGVVTVDPDIEKKMADFFDIAQKDVAGYKRIVKEQDYVLQSTQTVYALPARFSRIFRVWLNGAMTNRYVQYPDGIAFPGAGNSFAQAVIPLDSVTEWYPLPSDFLSISGVTLDGEPTENFVLGTAGIKFPSKMTGIAQETITIDWDKDVYPLPEDFKEISEVLINGTETENYVLRPDGIAFPGVTSGTATVKYIASKGDAVMTYIAEIGTVKLEYFAVPATITPNTPDDHEFEVSEDAANCMPFFVAAQNLMPDLVVDYQAFLQTYYQMRGALDVTLPEGDGSGGVLRQTLFL